MKSTLAERIQIVLDHRRITAYDLSKRAGLSGSHVANILERNSSRSSLTTIAALARAAGVSETWLGKGEGDPGLTLNDALDDHRATDGVDIAPREAETPSTFGGFANYARVEKTARALAPEIPDWVWSATRNTHPLWLSSDPPGAQVVADVARLIMKHRPDK